MSKPHSLPNRHPQPALWLCLALCACMCLSALPLRAATHPVKELIERIDKGASGKFIIEQQASPTDFFELDSRNGKVVIRGNNPVSIATGLNWYLKYYAGIHLSWNGMQARLPETLPAVPHKERHETDTDLRYYLNYCTHSYSMAFWDWERWEREIDWMALHGINLPLAITGTECVWLNVLRRLGYPEEEARQFAAGPAFQAWWLMNNLESWGGPNPDSWYADRLELQRKILKRMRQMGMKPVLAGYSGMLPHDARTRLNLDVADPGLWCGYRRPAFLQPSDPEFPRIAQIYYTEMTRLFGKADYYSMDPFHEGGDVRGVDLPAAGQAIMDAMKRCNPKATWVVQAWGANPRPAMIRGLKNGDLLVLDLYSESRPQWGDSTSTWHRPEGFDGHHWLYCMLLNYGGNVGLHGKMQHVIDGYFKARGTRFGQTLRGTGLTMEGIENNPVMYELLCELPWRTEHFTKEEWLKQYVAARYGKHDDRLYDAWLLLAASIYNCPPQSTQQGTHESVFCARPADHVYQVSSWSEMSDYYDPHQVIEAARLFLEAAPALEGCDNYEYDLVDIVRQAVAEKARLVRHAMEAARKAGEKELFAHSADRFMQLLMVQDSLLATRPEFCLDTWLDRAWNLGQSPQDKALYVWNAKVQVTTWGNRQAADAGGLHDYAHKEWSGLLRDFYAMRWKLYIDTVMRGGCQSPTPSIDYYPLEEEWTLRPYTPHDPAHHTPDGPAHHTSSPGEAVKMARQAMKVLYAG